jgi:hypothetical protein
MISSSSSIALYSILLIYQYGVTEHDGSLALKPSLLKMVVGSVLSQNKMACHCFGCFDVGSRKVGASKLERCPFLPSFLHPRSCCLLTRTLFLVVASRLERCIFKLPSYTRPSFSVCESVKAIGNRMKAGLRGGVLGFESISSRRPFRRFLSFVLAPLLRCLRGRRGHRRENAEEATATAAAAAAGGSRWLRWLSLRCLLRLLLSRRR